MCSGTARLRTRRHRRTCIRSPAVWWHPCTPAGSVGRRTSTAKCRRSLCLPSSSPYPPRIWGRCSCRLPGRCSRRVRGRRRCRCTGIRKASPRKVASPAGRRSYSPVCRSRVPCPSSSPSPCPAPGLRRSCPPGSGSRCTAPARAPRRRQKRKARHSRKETRVSWAVLVVAHRRKNYKDRLTPRRKWRIGPPETPCRWCRQSSARSARQKNPGWRNCSCLQTSKT